MRVQRKHDIVQAKLKKERQQEKGGTPGAPDPKPKAPAPAGKAGGTNPPPKGEKKTLEPERKREALTRNTSDDKERYSA